MATDQEQRPHHAEANQEPPTVAVPTKPGVAACDPPEEKLSGTEIPAADAIVFKNDVSHSTNRVTDFSEDETESIESSGGSTPRDETARQERMEVEANAYLESETRKVNARAHAAQVSSPNLVYMRFPLCAASLLPRWPLIWDNIRGSSFVASTNTRHCDHRKRNFRL